MRELFDSRISYTLLTVKLVLASAAFSVGVGGVGIAGFGLRVGWFAGFDTDGSIGRGVIGLGFGFEAGLDWEVEIAGLFGLFAGRDAVGRRVGRPF